MTEVNTLTFVKELDDSNNEYLLDSESTDSPVFDNLFYEYEQVIIKSLITSFGLDQILISDRHGGDVDTIHTVRDSSVTDYADQRSADDYNNRGTYDSDKYHKHKDYMAKNCQVSNQKKSGNLEDAYTGKKVNINANIDLDHTISAKEIHDDPGRVLTGLNGEDLANRNTNLYATDRSINRSKKAKSVDEFLEKLDSDKQKRNDRISELKSKSNLSDQESKELNKLEKLESVDAEKVKEKDEKAREAYEAELASTYYGSKKFLKATAKAGLIKGGKMALRQCLGLLLSEIWFAVEEDFPKIAASMKENFDLPEFLKNVAESVKKAFGNIKEKYKELIFSFGSGFLAGLLSSISSTLINIFFTTAKCAGRILRESWASIIEAIKILVYNPDNLPFGEVLKAVAKIVAASVSVICGSLVQEAVSKMNPVKLPIIADVLPAFIGSVVTGIMTVSMLYFLDHSKAVEKIVEFANRLKDQFDAKLDYYKEVTIRLTAYVSQLANIDYDALEKEVSNFKNINIRLTAASTTSELNEALHTILNEKKIRLPYETLDELDLFMNDKDSVLVI